MVLYHHTMAQVYNYLREMERTIFKTRGAAERFRTRNNIGLYGVSISCRKFGQLTITKHIYFTRMHRGRQAKMSKRRCQEKHQRT